MNVVATIISNTDPFPERSVHTEYSANGFITFWNLTSGTHSVYEHGFNQLGLKNLTPAEQTPRQALKEATHDLMTGSYLFRQSQRRIMKPRHPHEKFACFDVYVQKDQDLNLPETYSKPPPLIPAFTTRLAKDNDLVTFEKHEGVTRIATARPAGIQVATTHLQAIYTAERNVCTPSAVSKSLTAVLEQFNCTSLRPSRGGIHWVPEEKIEKWKAVADLVDKSSRQSAEKYTSHVYILTVKRDKNLLLAVKEGLTRSIAATASALVADLQNSDLGKRAVQNRQKEAISLKKKVEEYEQILGETLDHLHAACDIAKSVAAEAVVARM